MAGHRAGLDDVWVGNLVSLLLQEGGVRLELDRVQNVQQALIWVGCSLGQLVEGARLRAQFVGTCHGGLHGVYRSPSTHMCSSGHKVRERETRKVTARSRRCFPLPHYGFHAASPLCVGNARFQLRFCSGWTPVQANTRNSQRNASAWPKKPRESIIAPS